MDNLNNNNLLKIGGIISSEPILNHEAYDEKFYKFYIDSKRLSSSFDRLPIIISERIIDIDLLKVGKSVFIEGQFRSYNEVNEIKSKLILSTFVKKIEIVDKLNKHQSQNELIIEGYLCKKPIYRETPLGREISDILVAVNRGYKKSDYIPCILWGRNAKFCDSLNVGDKVRILGRIQARDYEKKIENGNILKNTAYEVSAFRIAKI